MANKFHYYKREPLRWRISETRARCLTLPGKFMAMAAIGVYTELLDYCCIEGSVPADLAGLAAVAGCSVEEMEEIWPHIQHKFEPQKNHSDRLIMPTVESRRKRQREESRRQSRNGKKSAEKRVQPKVLEFNNLHDSGCQLVESGSGLAKSGSTLNKKQEIRNKKLETTNKKERAVEAEPSQRFAEWWALWSASRGTNHENAAAQAWLSTVTDANADELFECTRSYLASRTGLSGYNPENFIFDQFRDLFRARWPPANPAPKFNSAEFWGMESGVEKRQ